jgi:hypothetical protein
MDDFQNLTTDLLLIDPPDFGDLDKALCFFDKVDNFILWLPVTTIDGVEAENSNLAMRKCQASGLSIISVFWEGSMNTRGCRLVYRLPDEAIVSMLSALREITKLMEWEMS